MTILVCVCVCCYHLCSHFQGVGLDKLQSSMDSHLRDLLLADQRGCGTALWREEGLFDLCYGLLFR